MKCDLSKIKAHIERDVLERSGNKLFLYKV